MGKHGRRRTFAVCLIAAVAALSIPIRLFAQSGAVFWSDRQSHGIYRISGPGGQHQLIVPNAGSPWGIAIDPINHYIYWGDDDASTARKITRSNFDGSNQVIVLSEQPVSGGGSQFVEGLSLDAVHDYLYYAEGNTRTVRRVHTDGTGEEVIVHGRLNGPVDVKLDVANGYMYWTQIISTHSELYRARLDGSDQKLLFSDQGFYYDLALAPAQGSGYLGDYIYFADQHPNYFGIRRIGIDGSDPVTLVHQDGLEPSGLEIDPTSRMIYWSRRDRPGIWRATLEGGMVEEITDPAQFPFGAYTIDFTLEDTAAFAAAIPLPEPAAAALLGIGAAVAGSRPRRRRR